MWQWNDGTMELCHYGVKGMKWGVRKARPQGDTTGMVRRKEFHSAFQLFGVLQTHHFMLFFHNFFLVSPLYIKKH